MRQPIVFGKYLLLERISVGGMAEVFKAKSFGEEGFEKILAIKRILPSMAEDEEFIEMFIDEAKISGQLSHPNIGQIFELGRIESSYFIAMEYVWGKDVLQIQNRFRRHRRTMPLPMAVFIASRVCEGLDYAHRKKDDTHTPLHIIHRDVSPQNVLVSYSGEVKIIDFGIAKARSRSSKTQAGVLKGKFGYMSPEQVRALPLDQRSDVFSIGTILFEMCTGERLFTGESDFATLEKVRNAIVPQPSKVNPKIPPDLVAIILRALKRDGAERYEWASELQAELTGFLMQQHPIFTTKNLSGTVSELFGKERTREQAAMEKYKQIRKSDLESFLSPATARREMAISLLPHGPPQATMPDMLPVLSADPAPGSDSEDEFDDAATQIGGPSFKASLQGDPDDAPMLSADDLVELVEEESQSPENQTNIFGDAMAAEVNESLPAEPTFIFNMESGQMVHAAEQPTVIFADKGGNGDGTNAEQRPDQGPTVIFDAAGAPVTGEVSGTAAVAVADRPPSLIKDILIGVLVALVVIMGIVVWRVFSQGTTGTATLVISTTPPGTAEVVLDGKSKGKLKSGTPFMIENLEPRTYRIALKKKGVLLPVVQKVAVRAGQVKVLNLQLPQPAAKAHLVLLITPKGARVLLDGAEVSQGAAKEPLELTSGTPHEVRVEKEGFKPEALKVNLPAGERAERTITLQPAPTTLKIESQPPGAQVSLNGEKKGTTPVTVEGLKPGRHRVKVTLDKHSAQSQWVEVEASKHAAVSFYLKPKLEKPEGSDPVAVAPKTPETTPKQPDRGTSPTPKKPERGSTQPKKPKKPRKPNKPEKPDKPDKPAAGNMGYLVANTIPWAKVFVDGRDTGKTTPVAPRSKIPLKPGRHKITFVVEGKRFDYKVNIRAGEITRLIKKLRVQ